MDEGDLTRDAFLGGRVHAWQPTKGYRAGADAVLLASAVRAEARQRVLELGCGVGVASLCLAARVAGISITAVDLDAQAAALAERNAKESAANIAVYHADIRDLPSELREQSFDHVLMNPPYFASGTPSPDANRASSRHEDTQLSDWIRTGIRRLRPGGELVVIHKSERLPDLVRLLDGPCGAIDVTPIVGRRARPANRVVVRARKGAKAPFSLNFPLIMHTGDVHVSDGENHSEAATKLLRGGAALDAVIYR